MLLFLSDFAIISDSVMQYCPSAGYLSPYFYVFWSDTRPPKNAIYGARISRTGVVIDSGGRPIYFGNPTFGAEVETDGENFLVVFRDSC
ncbi:hypothetical protein DRP53_06245 [candidate division WOR-3 bacterium]|uniref:Uncharacterized protein n=1 Tax=candidate division WOR-3 bacterium TaxID=2052148 RepID=A0A660SJA9_UNCW3|nr:MAG: hypothetical protein DRP53_06245 [candidate division WOR-3 bacterium]